MKRIGRGRVVAALVGLALVGCPRQENPGPSSTPPAPDTPGAVTWEGGYGICNDAGADATGVYIGGNGENGWRIEKRDPATLDPVTAFGGQGTLEINHYGYVQCVVSDAGALYAVGTFSNLDANYNWRSDLHIEKRDALTGAPVAEFGVAGSLEVANDFDSLYVLKAVVDGSRLYVLYFIYIQPPSGSPVRHWKLEARDKTTGVLDAGFGSGGALDLDPYRVSSMAVDAANIYICGADDGSHAQWIGCFSKTTGQTGSFPPILVDRSPYLTGASAIALDGTSMYVLGGDIDTAFPISQRTRLEKRRLSDGTLVAGFGTGGEVLSEWAFGEGPVSVVVDSGTLYTLTQSSGITVGKHDAVTGALRIDWYAGGRFTVGSPSSSSLSMQRGRGVVVAGERLCMASTVLDPRLQWHVASLAK